MDISINITIPTTTDITDTNSTYYTSLTKTGISIPSSLPHQFINFSVGEKREKRVCKGYS